MVGKSKKRGQRSSYRLLMLHLLKWEFQPERRSRSWRNTIDRERENIIDYEEKGIGHRIGEADFDDLYQSARRLAADETGLPLGAFPSLCPYSLDMLRDLSAMPDPSPCR